MQSRLIVKNFGPIKSVDLNLRNVNVFIGPQATGKSALAKLYTIFKAPRKFLKDQILPEGGLVTDGSGFRGTLFEYNIDSFLTPTTEIRFESELHNLYYQNDLITYEPKLLQRILRIESLANEFEANIDLLQKEISEIARSFILFALKASEILKGKDQSVFSILQLESLEGFKKLQPEDLFKLMEIIKGQEAALSTNAALYIPAERAFINIIRNASLNLLNNNVPIPKHILSFGAELEKSGLKEIDLGFLQQNLVYKNINGEERIFTDSVHSIKLGDAASGIQSVLPILIPIKFRENMVDHRSFVIEEPELNLFPLAQYELIQKLESNRREAYWEDYGTIHTYTTHSPFVLSTINNLLYAHKVELSLRSKLDGNTTDKQLAARKIVNRIVSATINPSYFTAYQISNGEAFPILDRDTGLISDNYIDEASDKLGDDFDALSDLLD